MNKTYDLTNAQVIEYLYRRKRINDGNTTPQIERNRQRLSWRRLLFYGRGVVLPFTRKEKVSHKRNKRAGQGCA